MNYKLLGNSGLRVSDLCLGTMTFGEEWEWGSSEDESRSVFDAFVDSGGNFLDTANLYTEGTSERLVGEFIREERERFVLATKFSLSTRKDDPNGGGNSRKNMMQAVEASLRNIGTDYIDLYWVHAWDFLTPEEEVMRGLDDLVRSGKILYIGISDTPAWVVARSNTIAELRGWSSFAALQIKYSLIDRTPERDLLPMADAFNLTVTPWSVLGGGVLSGKYNNTQGVVDGKRHKDKPRGEGPLEERNLVIAELVGEIANELGCTASQVALAWVMSQSGNFIPIVGARTLKQLRDNLGSLDVTLSDKHHSALDEITKIELGFPHDFLSQEFVKNLLIGDFQDRIFNHRK